MHIIMSNIEVVSKFSDRSRGRSEGSLFNSYYTEVLVGGATPSSRFLYFTLDTYLLMLSVKQGSIKYHFLSFWNGIEPCFSWVMGEHSSHKANETVKNIKWT